MRLTPRRRAFLAVAISLPLGYLYLYVALHLATNLVRDWRDGLVVCTNTTLRSLDAFNGCGLGASFHASYASIELLILTVLAVVIGYGLARWVTWPLRQIADTIGRFGPTSLGLRLRADGPRDETRRLSDEIDAMLDRLAEGYDAQRRFASNASHELRTPLATQRALIEVSLTSALTAEQLELLSRQLLATNERNEQLIDGLLTLAETERGLMTNSPLRLDRIVEDTVESLQAAAKEREVRIDLALEPVTVSGEQPLLERLAHNLVFNAMKYNHPGGTVVVGVTRDGAFSVANTGPVVASEEVAGLFEPFRRASGDRLDHGGGVGLGLTIARSIATTHGATIEADANPGGGLTIVVRLPGSTEAAPGSRRLARTPAPREVPPGPPAVAPRASRP
ncbi:MAG TPA: HAMP domain-containing sensor histidine kinase [Mycobacteriales bacterium]|nr:HAMP domain-containing sensor histidine kinase [Mycobacteriales bacterium]